MIELKPVPWRLLIEQWQAATAFGIFFAIYKWLLDWPAPWILLLLFARVLVHCFLYRKNLHLIISDNKISGPTWTKVSRVSLDLHDEIVQTRFLGITTLKDPNEKEISFRRSWYHPDEIKAFEKLL